MSSISRTNSTSRSMTTGGRALDGGASAFFDHVDGRLPFPDVYDVGNRITPGAAIALGHAGGGGGGYQLRHDAFFAPFPPPPQSHQQSLDQSTFGQEGVQYRPFSLASSPHSPNTTFRSRNSSATTWSIPSPATTAASPMEHNPWDHGQYGAPSDQTYQSFNPSDSFHSSNQPYHHPSEQSCNPSEQSYRHLDRQSGNPPDQTYLPANQYFPDQTHHSLDHQYHQGQPYHPSNQSFPDQSYHPLDQSYQDQSYRPLEQAPHPEDGYPPNTATSPPLGSSSSSRLCISSLLNEPSTGVEQQQFTLSTPAPAVHTPVIPTAPTLSTLNAPTISTSTLPTAPTISTPILLTPQPPPSYNHHINTVPSPPAPPQFKYRLTVRQQPTAARACGFGERDRRTVDPPPILQLSLADLASAPSAKRAAEALAQSNFVIHCTLRAPDGVSSQSEMPPEYAHCRTQAQSRLTGSLAVSPFVGTDEHGILGTFFPFSDLSVRTPGRFTLFFALYQIVPGQRAPRLAETISDVFVAFSPKEFPGMQASTPLTAALRAQGCHLGIKQGTEKRVGRGRARGRAVREVESDDEAGE